MDDETAYRLIDVLNGIEAELATICETMKIQTLMNIAGSTPTCRYGEIHKQIMNWVGSVLPDEKD